MCVCVSLVHVHAGNVVVDGDHCRLLDLENSLLSLPSLHRRSYSQLHKLNVSVEYNREEKRHCVCASN